MKIPFYLLFTVLNNISLGLPWDGPTTTPQTGANPSKYTEYAPSPTQVPQIMGRDVTTLPPEFCGYLRGTIPYSFCNQFSTCLWRTDISAVGCCRDVTNINTCGMYTTCLNYWDVTGLPSSISSNPLVLSCSISNYGYCGSLRFQPSFYNYVCSNSHYYWDVSLALTNASTNETVTAAGIPRFVGPNTTPVITSNTSMPITTISTSSVLSITPTLSPNPPLNIGAIVGGSIGGFVVLCVTVVILAVLFLHRRRAKSITAVSSPTPVPQYMPYRNELPAGATATELKGSQPQYEIYRAE